MKYIIINSSNGDHMFVTDFPVFLTEGDRVQKNHKEYEVVYTRLLIGEKQVRTYVREL